LISIWLILFKKLLITGFVIGFAIGFVFSMPPLGPTYFAIIERSLKHQFTNAVSVGVGAGFMDMFYILIAYGGVAAIVSLLPSSVTGLFLKNEDMLKIILGLAGCVVVILYGVKIMRTRNSTIIEKETVQSEKFKKKYETVENVFKRTEMGIEKITHHKTALEEKHSDLVGSFLLGIVMCLSSVTLPASWFAVVGYLKSYGLIDSNIFTGILLSIGVLIGTSAWFYLMAKLIMKYSSKIKPSTLNKLNISTGIFLIILGVSLLIKLSTMYF